MFWKRKKDRSQTPAATTEISNTAAEVCHVRQANLDLRRAVLEWRDRHIEAVERHLDRELISLNQELDQQLRKMSWADLLNQKRFANNNLQPIYDQWCEREVALLIDQAQGELSSIFAHSLEYAEVSRSIDQELNAQSSKDAVMAVAATGAGVGSIPAFVSMSTVSAGGILGFFGVTTVAWPVVAVAVVTAAGLLTLGGYKATTMRNSAISRLHTSTTKKIAEEVLSYHSGESSLRTRLQAYISDTAAQIILEIDR